MVAAEEDRAAKTAEEQLRRAFNQTQVELEHERGKATKQLHAAEKQEAAFRQMLHDNKPADLSKIRRTMKALQGKSDVQFTDTPAEDVLEFFTDYFRDSLEVTVVKSPGEVRHVSITYSTKPKEKVGETLSVVLAKFNWTWCIQSQGKILLVPMDQPKN